jgi:hypothetical protein
MIESAAGYTEQQMLAAGGKLWEKGARRRVYFGDWTALVGLVVERHDKGAIRTARVLGAELSPQRAGVLLADKVFWEDGVLHFPDVASHSKHFYSDDRLVTALLAGIAQAVKGGKAKR